MGTFAIYPSTTGMPHQSFIDLMARAQHLACLALESDLVKKTEAKLARQSVLLTKAETIVGLGSFEWELSSNKLSWSDQLYKIFGYDSSKPEDLKLDFFLSRVHPDDRDEASATLEEALRSRTGYRNQKRIVRPDGEVRVIESFGEVQCDSEGRPTHFAGGCLDITERQEIEKRLAQSQKMEAIKRLAGGIAHDFNNLLTIITGQAAELLDHGSDRPPDKGALSDILEAGERAASLTSRLLDFSETKRLKASVVDLKAVLLNTLRLVKRSLPRTVRIEENFASDSTCIRANQSQIEQLVFNLLLNAGEAMQEEGVLSVSLRTIDELPGHIELQPGPYLELCIQDNGIGIEEEFLSQIFEPFSTNKELGDGRGLGLAVAHGTVSRWGGHIEFLSPNGPGTVARIHFPRAAATPSDAPTPHVGMEKGNATVLVVDDEDAVRRLVTRILSRGGFTVLQAENAEEALEVSEKHDFELLVTDIVMPGMTGDNLAKAIRARKLEMPILLISGYTQEDIDLSSVMNEKTRFLSKPFTSRVLLSTVEELLN